MKKYTFIYLAILSIFTLPSCEKVIDVKTGNGEPQLAIDAFLDNIPLKNQQIELTKAGEFFSSGSLSPALGASVKVSNGTTEYTFLDLNSDGKYILDLPSDSTMIQLGNTYSLTINYKGFEYTSVAKALPVPLIDSINYEFSPGQFGGDGTYITELVAKDLLGQSDYYWIKAYQNGILYNSINVSVDGSFSEESQNDGKLFIAPISTFASVNPDDTLGLGDIRKFEIWSISRNTLKFWQEVLNQEIQGGIGALFSTPLANVRTNIESNATDAEDRAVGWFSVSTVSIMEVTITDNPNEKLSFTEN